MLHFETIEPGTLQLLKSLQSIPLLQETLLVGGTALALQLGHRNSVDLDFFGSVPYTSEEIRDALSDNHSITVVKESKNINIYLLDSIKVDIVNYKYQWIDTGVIADDISLASIKDIAAMKITAIIGRGTKKDFIDLFFMLKLFSLQDILDFYMEKYPDGSVFLALKSLTFYGDAEHDPMPIMFTDVSWDEIKTSIRSAVTSLIKNQ